MTHHLNSNHTAYYNAGSAALVLLLIAIALGLFFYVRNRRRRNAAGEGHVALARDEEESIPLSRSIGGNEVEREEGAYSPTHSSEAKTASNGHAWKGKRRATQEDLTPMASREALFDVGDSDEDETPRR
jgi:carboxypeptidase D